MTSSSTAWHNACNRIATRALGSAQAQPLLATYRSLFTKEYQTLITPSYAVRDILALHSLVTTDPQQVNLVKITKATEVFRLHFYSNTERYLDEYIPLLENIGLRVLDQVQFTCTYTQNEQVIVGYIKSFTLKVGAELVLDWLSLKRYLLTGLRAILRHQVDNDALNKLAIVAGLTWQATDLIRAYCNYYLQLGHSTARDSVYRTLINHPKVAACLFHYFDARFVPNPAWQALAFREEQCLLPLRTELSQHLASVANINEDRILRALFNLIDATVRSNFHQRCMQDDFFIALKISSLGIIDMPSPRPCYEIYVHAYEMEGIHLRAGKIARGGIRWSDRPDDFRTEILGLMQTQVSKNALIIPTGAKGGFIVKPNAQFSDYQVAGQHAYLRLITGLLELTDNHTLHDVDKTTAVIYDDPDSYLVVAADKGTAHFSDSANQLANQYGFWLHDAFASGGSQGYDHKALGITARGAWECIRRHFYELGKDIQTEAISVLGIGSMDGDVFGNGMLLSLHLQLRAAFSGQHIFIDPTPSPLAFAERQRLFMLPRSSWLDYAPALISKGGGVYSRYDKEIILSEEVKNWLGIRYHSVDGESLIRYLLTASVDLLWLGGIGTYVKCSEEKHLEVGDRSNDSVRVNANEIKARVVGEGANLGFTQKARIEYALAGGRINTDAVDNSAGVDTSDHEVNLKIMLMALHKKGLIADYQPLFEAMTESVCELVLANNVAQSRCLSLEQIRCQQALDNFLQVADVLEASGFLDKTVEAFPQTKQLLTRRQACLTRPELAVLMASAKRFLTHILVQNTASLPADYYADVLASYFPAPFVEAFRRHLASHPLAQHIQATLLSNHIINYQGCSFLLLNQTQNPARLMEAIASYVLYEQALEIKTVRAELHKQTNVNNAKEIVAYYHDLLVIEDRLLGFCQWHINHHVSVYPDTHTQAIYAAYYAEYRLYSATSTALSSSQAHCNIKQALQLINGCEDLPLIAQLCQDTAQPFSAQWVLFNEVVAMLDLSAIQAALFRFAVKDQWEAKVHRLLCDELKLSVVSLSQKLSYSASAPRSSWRDYFQLPENSAAWQSYQRVHHEICQATPMSLFPYLVLAEELKKL